MNQVLLFQMCPKQLIKDLQIHQMIKDRHVYFLTHSMTASIQRWVYSQHRIGWRWKRNSQIIRIVDQKENKLREPLKNFNQVVVGCLYNRILHREMLCFSSTLMHIQMEFSIKIIVQIISRVLLWVLTIMWIWKPQCSKPLITEVD